MDKEEHRLRMNFVTNYITAFKKLHRAHLHGGAPHKPILLLSILEGVSRGEIKSNQIFITPELILCFKELWIKMVRTPHQMNFALPFYHMRTESFWKLICKPGHEIALTSSNSIKSLNALNESLLYAEIDKELFLLMNDAQSNSVLRMTILAKYFPNLPDVSVDYGLLKSFEHQILNEDPEQYKNRIESLQSNSSKEEVEQDLYVRSALFKRQIPKIYDYTCAISRMRVISAANYQMVDACHIVPFSVSKDDTIGNGISLSPNFHRAFDRGLISISEDFKVIVSQQLKEDQSPYSISQFDGRRIMLPETSQYQPKIENLKWHHANRLLR